MSGSARRPDRRGLVRRGARTAATSTSCSRGAARPTAAAAAGALASPRPGPRAVPRLPRARRRVVRPTTIVVNKSTIDGDAARADHLGRGAARHRAGRARRGRRRACSTPPRRPTCSSARRASGSTRRRTTRRPCGAANREAMRGAIADALAAAVAPMRCARSPSARERGRRTRSTAATDAMRIAALEVRRYARRRSTRRSAPPGIPVPRDARSRRRS